MASDLISRSALLAEYDRVHVGEPGGARKLIAEAPAVDAVEVVRCKDCKHCFQWKIPFCDAEIGLHPIPHNIEIWFCPFGERKENAVD